MSLLELGVIGRSAKENELRLPIHPDHLSRIEPEVAAKITLEHGYGATFGREDAELAALVGGGMATREEILERCDVVLLPKPQLEDVAALRAGQTLWGWPHCVQSTELTQLAIDQRLTLIAFEAMNHWTRDQTVGLHVFHKNNELAGYCSVLHALQLVGSTGDYGRHLTAAVIGFGATARGAVTALSAQGIHQVSVLTTRGVAAVASPIHSVRIVQLDHDPDGDSHAITSLGRVPLATFLAERDIVVNCTLQDPASPLMYLRSDDLDAFRAGSLVIDVSCDEGMGFDWARPTSFDDPMFDVGDGVHYYAVDHSPSYLWNSATWEVSEAVLPFLRPVLEGPDAWEMDETLNRAIEIQDGQVKNPAILDFQHRGPEYPYPVT